MIRNCIYKKISFFKEKRYTLIFLIRYVDMHIVVKMIQSYLKLILKYIYVYTHREVTTACPHMIHTTIPMEMRITGR